MESLKIILLYILAAIVYGICHDQVTARVCVEYFTIGHPPIFHTDSPTLKAEFGPSVYKRAKKAGMGIIALKSMAHQQWPRGKKHRWAKTFYEPFDEIDRAALGLRFTLHLPVDAMFPPGHWELFKMALDLAKAGALTPLNKNERKLITDIAGKCSPIFP